MNDTDEPSDDAVTSRTQRKREALDLQKIGQRLVDLDPGDLATVPTTPELDEAIALWKRIRSHEAKRRQLQFIGKLMRRIDLDPIEAALSRIEGTSAEARYAFHQLESWRDRLINEPEALTEYLNQHPEADRQLLRHQITRVRKATDDTQRKTQARALFRLLRDFESP
jgi:ribosome-associated protein